MLQLDGPGVGGRRQSAQFVHQAALMLYFGPADARRGRRPSLPSLITSVEALTGTAPCWFAYPDGTFTEREQHAVEAVGFAGAVQTFRRPGGGGR